MLCCILELSCTDKIIFMCTQENNTIFWCWRGHQMVSNSDTVFRAWPRHSPVGGLTVLTKSLTLTLTVPANVLLYLLLTSLSICIGLRIHYTLFSTFPRPVLGIWPSFFLPLLASPFPMVPLWWFSLVLVTRSWSWSSGLRVVDGTASGSWSFAPTPRLSATGFVWLHT